MVKNWLPSGSPPLSQPACFSAHGEQLPEPRANGQKILRQEACPFERVLLSVTPDGEASLRAMAAGSMETLKSEP